MGKLHELLAVESNLKGQANKVRTDLMTTFEKKPILFSERRKTYQAFAEGSPAALMIEENLEMQNTVAKEIAWVNKHIAKALNASLMVDRANTQAKADIVTEDGVIIFKDVPATYLLQLEKRVKELKALIDRIPTFDPARGYRPDETRERGIYVARDIERIRTVKDQKVIELSKATDKHPAQVTLQQFDREVGKLREQEWSSLLTPAKKSDLLDRVETLYRAVTSARSKANETAVDGKEKIGEAILDYLFQPLELA